MAKKYLAREASQQTSPPTNGKREMSLNNYQQIFLQSTLEEKCPFYLLLSQRHIYRANISENNESIRDSI